jgi:hypothetical protein
VDGDRVVESGVDPWPPGEPYGWRSDVASARHRGDKRESRRALSPVSRRPSLLGQIRGPVRLCRVLNDSNVMGAREAQ